MLRATTACNFCSAPAALRSHKSLEKHSESRLSYLVAHLHLLSSDLSLLTLLTSDFQPSILSEVFTSKLPSTILDLIQMTMMIKSISFQMIMDHHLTMIWIYQEYRTWGKQIYQVYHQLRLPILTFPSKRLLILDKMTILHQDLIRRQSLSGFKGNRDILTDSTDALPKAKAKVIIKRPKVQLPSHVKPISVPTHKP